MHQPQIASLPGAIATLPGYYYLYALYFDYPLNQAWWSAREYAAAMEELVRAIQPLRRYIAPNRKSFALRLFTERQALARFRPELVDEALRQWRGLIERVGPPAGWPRPPRPRRPRQGPGRAIRPAAPRTAPHAVPQPHPRPMAPFRRSPIDYSREA
ncbi:MAG: hypothetical protein HY423_08375 [Candidatus Lambdaproteobacteria bacterium]|nr:hypothetical protein [Candidatus Lambdaproteobacteria bacterium]